MGNPAKGRGLYRRSKDQLYIEGEEHWVVQSAHEEGHRRRWESPSDSPVTERPEATCSTGDGTISGASTQDALEDAEILRSSGFPLIDRIRADSESVEGETAECGRRDHVITSTEVDSDPPEQPEEGAAADEEITEKSDPEKILESAGDFSSEPASTGARSQEIESADCSERDLKEAGNRLEELSLVGREPVLSDEQRLYNDQLQEDEVSTPTWPNFSVGRALLDKCFLPRISPDRT